MADFTGQNIQDTFQRVDDINGRVRDNEKSISWIKGVGASVTFLITSVLGYLIKE